ncbi:ABC transporter permease [Micromonospora sp. NPDC048830]|uniref:ABC transporter permease n=1 Tax=Micromonospora sp. NPDC048830 TaxID=3364257 RepID=UPI003716B5A7
METWRRFVKQPTGVAGLSIIALFAVIAVFADLLATDRPGATGPDTLLNPGSQAYMGTDSLGRDVFSQFVHGARLSLLVGLLAAALAIIIGVLVGSLSGYFGGWLDTALMRLTELFQVVPRFILALVVVAMIGGGIDRIIAVIGLLSWPPAARIVRAEFLSLREQEFVEASKAVGLRTRTTIFSEILPNALPPVVVIASLDVAQAILLEASLSFLGLGDPDVVSWGTMLHQAQQYLREAWWLSVFPGMAIFLAVLAFNLLGDAFNDARNPRLKKG